VKNGYNGTDGINEPMTTVYLIRHGQTEGSGEKRYKGHIDVPLSAEGVEQARRLAGYLSGLTENGGHPAGGLHGVFSSDLSRAVRTAEIVASRFGLGVEIMPEFRERHFGRWEGMTWDEIREAYPAEFRAWADNPLEFSPVGGESTIEVRERVMPAFYRLIWKNEGRHIALVAHGGVNRIILCDILGIPLEHIFRVEQDFAGLNIIQFHGDVPVVKMLNFTA